MEITGQLRKVEEIKGLSKVWHSAADKRLPVTAADS